MSFQLGDRVQISRGNDWYEDERGELRTYDGLYIDIPMECIDLEGTIVHFVGPPHSGSVGVEFDCWVEGGHDCNGHTQRYGHGRYFQREYLIKVNRVIEKRGFSKWILRNE